MTFAAVAVIGLVAARLLPLAQPDHDLPDPRRHSDLRCDDCVADHRADARSDDYRIQGTHPIERVEAAVDTVEGFFRARQKELGIERIYTVYQAERAQSVIVLRGDGIKGADFVQRFEKKLPEILIGEPTFNLDDQNGQDEGRFSLKVTGESTERLAAVDFLVSRAASAS